MAEILDENRQKNLERHLRASVPPKTAQRIVESLAEKVMEEMDTLLTCQVAAEKGMMPRSDCTEAMDNTNKIIFGKVRMSGVEKAAFIHAVSVIDIPIKELDRHEEALFDKLHNTPEGEGVPSASEKAAQTMVQALLKREKSSRGKGGMGGLH